jgi:hypothetical protein
MLVACRHTARGWLGQAGTTKIAACRRLADQLWSAFARVGITLENYFALDTTE